jgi:hypothetical protein
MTGCLMNNELERILKATAVLDLRYLTVPVFALRVQDNRSPGRDLNPGPPRYEAGVPDHLCRLFDKSK